MRLPGLPPYQHGLLELPNGARMPFTQLGTGRIPVVVVPGAGDGLRTADEGALLLAWYYRRRARSQRLLVLSRRQPIPEGYTVEQHADDYLAALAQLGWGPGIVECNSAGGPIGQWLAVKRPELVRGLILSVTFHRTDAQLRGVLEHWRQLAEAGRWADLQWSSIEHTFRPRTVARYRLARPVLRLLATPRHPERLPRILAGLLAVDNSPILPRITCPALVIGGAQDRVVPAELQREMAALIPTSRLLLYAGYGHGNDQENPDYERQATRFMREVWHGMPPASGPGSG